MAIGYPNSNTGIASVPADNFNHTFGKGVAFRGAWANVPNTESLAANKTIAINDPWCHFFTPTAARNVTMPATTTVGTWLIVNVDTTYTLTIKDAAATTIGTVGPSQAALVVCDGTTWTISRFMGGTTISSAYTQTYSTADRTVAAVTSHTITDNSAGTPSTSAIAALADGTTYATDVAAIRNNFATLAAELALVKADLLAMKKNDNAIIDDLQAKGISG